MKTTLMAQNISNQLSRRTWIRDAAIAATSVAVVPSMLISCSDHKIPPVGGIQDVPLTPEQLKAAAQNLLYMNAFIQDVYTYTSNYEDTVLDYLKGGALPSEWADFAIDILVAIGTGIAGAVAAAVATATAGALGAATAAALAVLADVIKKFALSGQTPVNLDTTFAVFKNAHEAMQKSISDKLIILSDSTDNFKNLRDAFKDGSTVINCKSYTLADLAGSSFPHVDHPSDNNALYVEMRDAAYLDFEKSVWKYMLIKAGELRASFTISDSSYNSPVLIARNGYYKDHKNGYMRGISLGHSTNPDGTATFSNYEFGTWYFRVGGRDLSDEAATKLFKDDTPGHIINPDGLFNRDYVYKQFHLEKPTFDRHDFRSDEEIGPNGGDAYGFALPDDFTFTGGKPEPSC